MSDVRRQTKLGMDMWSNKFIDVPICTDDTHPQSSRNAIRAINFSSTFNATDDPSEVSGLCVARSKDGIGC